ncbi:MAG: hypothetical protein ACPGWR_12570 [Ardenticatenaceae bacterium]
MRVLPSEQAHDACSTFRTSSRCVFYLPNEEILRSAQEGCMRVLPKQPEQAHDACSTFAA